jgi:hypothetical protein
VGARLASIVPRRFLADDVEPQNGNAQKVATGPICRAFSNPCLEQPACSFCVKNNLECKVVSPDPTADPPSMTSIHSFDSNNSNRQSKKSRLLLLPLSEDGKLKVSTLHTVLTSFSSKREAKDN